MARYEYTFEDERAKLSAAIALLHEIAAEFHADFDANRVNGNQVVNFAGSAAHSAASALQAALDEMDEKFDC